VRVHATGSNTEVSATDQRQLHESEDQPFNPADKGFSGNDQTKSNMMSESKALQTNPTPRESDEGGRNYFDVLLYKRLGEFLSTNPKELQLPMNRRPMIVRKALLNRVLDNFADSKSRICRNDLPCPTLLLRLPFRVVMRVEVKSREPSLAPDDLVIPGEPADSLGLCANADAGTAD
jgi:hypothetical protein